MPSRFIYKLAYSWSRRRADAERESGDDERDVFFVQMGEVDTEAPDRATRWRGLAFFGYEDRAEAEHFLALIRPLLDPSAAPESSPQMRERLEQWLREKEAEREARMSSLERLQQRVDEIRQRLYLYLVGPPRPVERIFRVVSSTELRSEGEHALRHAEQAASLGRWRRSDARDAGDGDDDA
jgi:hypothetical protein